MRSKRRGICAFHLLASSMDVRRYVQLPLSISSALFDRTNADCMTYCCRVQSIKHYSPLDLVFIRECGLQTSWKLQFYGVLNTVITYNKSDAVLQASDCCTMLYALFCTFPHSYHAIDFLCTDSFSVDFDGNV